MHINEYISYVLLLNRWVKQTSYSIPRLLPSQQFGLCMTFKSRINLFVWQV